MLAIDLCSYLDAPAHQMRIPATPEGEEASHQRCQGVRVNTVVATALC